MSAVLHPTGPETPRTYWIRRAAVLAAALLVVLVVLWAFRPSDGEVRAVPGPGASPAADPSPADPGPADPGPANPSPAGSPSPSDGAAQSGSPSPAATSADPTPREPGGGSGEAGSQGAASEEADSDDADAGEAEDEAGSDEADSEEPDRDDRDGADSAGTAGPAPEPEPVLCRGADVRVGLDGSSRPETGQPHELEISLTNEATDPCDLVLDESTVELRVFSGTDRIWTTEHCSDWLAVAEADRRLTLEPDQTHAWTLDWPVQRSAEDCELREQTLGEGTYVATALHRGSEPAQLVMVLS